MDFYSWLKQASKTEQQAVREMCGISHTYFRHIVHQRCKPSLKLINRIIWAVYKVNNIEITFTPPGMHIYIKRE